MSLSRIIIVIHFHADTTSFDPGSRQMNSQILHGVLVDSLYKAIGIAANRIVGHPDSAQSSVGVLIAPPPYRVRIGEHDHPLVHVKRPAVIPRQPGLVAWVGDKKRVQPTFGHFGTNQIQSAVIF